MTKTTQHDADIIAMYKNGVKLECIAEMYGTSTLRICRLSRDAGLPKRRATHKEARALRFEIAAMAEALGNKAAQQHYGISRERVNYARRCVRDWSRK